MITLIFECNHNITGVMYCDCILEQYYDLASGERSDGVTN